MKTLIMVIILFSVCLFDLKSQIWYQTGDTTGIIFTVDDYFDFPGGSDSIMSFFTKHIVYPDSSYNNKIGGIVTVELRIDSVGKVFDSKILKGVNNEIDIEVLRVCKLLPNWIPYNNKNKRKTKIQRNRFSFKFDPLTTGR